MKPSWPIALLVVGALAALAQPRWGISKNAVRQRGVDLLVCLDVSRSMLARDVAPDRLERARLELHNLSSILSADRLGLILVAGDAFRASPLTSDHQSWLALVDLASPQSVRQGGSDLAAALSQARSLLDAAPSSQKNVLLITDGEDRAGRATLEAELCREAGIVVHTLGIGTEVGGKITLTAEDGREFFLQDETGTEVISKLNVASLRSISEVTGGQFLQLESEVGVLRDWYTRNLLPQVRTAATGDPTLERENRFQLPLAVALLGAFFALAGYGRRSK